MAAINTEVEKPNNSLLHEFLLSLFAVVFGHNREQEGDPQPEMAAAKPLVSQQQLRGEVKQKNVLAADGRNRRVLQDIGNLVNDRAAVQGKVDGRAHDMHLQPEINPKMRPILVDWLIEVHRNFELMPETLYLTINIVDRFLALKVVPRRELQPVGISPRLIACKLMTFFYVSDNAYIREQVLAREKAFLENLECCVRCSMHALIRPHFGLKH